MKCPFCEYDLLLEDKRFSSFSLPKRRYLQAFVKYEKIVRLTEEYNGRVGDSERIRDLLKDCLNDMEMALELKFGERFPKFPRGSFPNSSWDYLWMHELAEIRNHANHVGTPFSKYRGGDKDGNCYLNHIAVIEVAENGIAKIIPACRTGKGEGKERSGGGLTPEKEVLPYLKETLEKIRKKLEITEI